MEVQITNERILKDILIEIEENIELKGTMTFKENKLIDGNIDVYVYAADKSVQQYIPIGFRVENGKATFAPSRMDLDLMEKVLVALKAIEDTFAIEIANNTQE